MLPEMVCAEELLRLIAFSEFVGVDKMSRAFVPVQPYSVGKLFAAIAASVEICKSIRRRLRLGRAVFSRWDAGCWIESISELSVECGTGPRVFAKM